MKKLVFFAAIAAVVLSSCSSQSGRRKDKMEILVEKIAAMTIDSCQYDAYGNILYFAGGDTVIKRQEFSVIVQDAMIYETNDVYTTITNLLTDKCPTPESYSSVCLRHFKQVIYTQPLDSSYVVHGYDGDYYNFYLPSYKITISLNDYVKFKSKGEISTYTINIYGESIYEFCSGMADWSEEQQQEILQLLLAKKDNKNSKTPVKEEPKFVLYSN